MKRFFLLICLIYSFFNVYGAPVDSIKIDQLVEDFICQNYTGNNDLRIKSIQLLALHKDTIDLSLVNLTPTGWMLVSKDDAVQPVYGYNFEEDFDIRSLSNNTGMSFVFSALDKQIKESLRKNPTALNPGWQLTKVKRQTVALSTDVQPLIPISWNQNKGWNHFCPEDVGGPDGHVYVGCAAVAMAQAMTVYKYPSKGVGTKSYYDSKYGTQTVNFDTYGSYNWTHIVDGLNTANNDIAALLYHCAVTVEMSFGIDGSGANMKSVAPALRNYFSYSKSVTAIDRVDSEAEWISILNNELVNGRPIVYGGDADDGKAGHAFNIDGVTSNGFYHLNWGWSGSNNGYFSISNLKPGTYDFTKNQSAVIGIKPIIPGPIDISLSNTTVQEGMPVGTVVGNIIVEDEYPDNTYSYTITGTYNIFDELNPVYFLQENGVLKTTKVFDYVSGKTNIEKLVVKVKDKYDHVLLKTLSVNILEDVSSVPVVELKPEDLLYYNPQNNSLEVSLYVEPKEIQVISLTGIVVSHSAEGARTLDVSRLSSGAYIAVLKIATGSVRSKFIKK